MASIRLAARISRSATLASLCGLVLAACQTPPASIPLPPPPSLQLVAASPLSLPPSCEASGSYFVSFTVLADGRTTAIKTPSGASCVNEALSAWVASFRYAPPAAPVETGVEWMLVSGKRGS
jgi:hypothetical protein